MTIPVMLAVILCVVGVILFGVATAAMSKRTSSTSDPLQVAGLHRRDRELIDMDILLRRLPDDSERRLLAKEHARFVTDTSPLQLRWMVLVYLGSILFLFGLDWISVVAIGVEILQLIVGFVCVKTTFGGWRFVRFSREFVVRRDG